MTSSFCNSSMIQYFSLVNFYIGCCIIFIYSTGADYIVHSKLSCPLCASTDLPLSWYEVISSFVYFRVNWMLAVHLAARFGLWANSFLIEWESTIKSQTQLFSVGQLLKVHCLINYYYSCYLWGILCMVECLVSLSNSECKLHAMDDSKKDAWCDAKMYFLGSRSFLKAFIGLGLHYMPLLFAISV